MNNSIILNTIEKKDIGFFPEEQELISDLGLYFDSEVIEHFEYFNFDNETLSIINDEVNKMNNFLSDKNLLDSVEQFWFAHKAGTTLDRSLIVHLYSKLPPDFPIGEMYVAFTDGYVSFQIVFLPTQIFPYLSSICLLQNETPENKEYISQILDRLSLTTYYEYIKSFK